MIAAVIRRSQVRSPLADVLGRASIRRRALEDMSAAVTYLIARGDKTAELLRKLLRSKHSHVNGLASARPMELGFPARIGGLAVVAVGESPGGGRDRLLRRADQAGHVPSGVEVVASALRPAIRGDP